MSTKKKKAPRPRLKTRAELKQDLDDMREGLDAANAEGQKFESDYVQERGRTARLQLMLNEANAKVRALYRFKADVLEDYYKAARAYFKEKECVADSAKKEWRVTIDTSIDKTSRGPE